MRRLLTFLSVVVGAIIGLFLGLGFKLGPALAESSIEPLRLFGQDLPFGTECLGALMLIGIVFFFGVNENETKISWISRPIAYMFFSITVFSFLGQFLFPAF